MLGKITNFYGLPNLNGAACRCKPPGDNIHQAAFAAAVRANNANAVIAEQHIIKIINIGFAAVIQPDVLTLNNGFAKTRANGRNFQLLLGFDVIYFFFQFIKALNALFAFGAACFRPAAYPRQFAPVHVAQALRCPGCRNAAFFALLQK